MLKNTLSVVDTQTTKKEKKEVEIPLFNKVDFPSPANHQHKMKLEEFLDLPPFPCQRNHETRVRKLERFLTVPIYGHNEVDVMIYKGKTTYDPAYFKEDETYVINGHTRQHSWKSRLSGQQLSSVRTLPVPTEVVVNTYEFTSAIDAINFYYSRDSLVAVEKKPDMVTGALRANNILANLQTPRIRKGAISTALDVACPYKPKSQFRVDNIETLIDQVGAMKETIVEMDKLSAPGQGALSTQYALGVAMLAGIQMEHDSRWVSAINRLIENEPSSINDGIDWLIKASASNPTGDATLDNALPYNTGLYNDRTGLLDYVSFCWQSYINGEKLTQAPVKKTILNSYSKMLHFVYRNKQEEQED
jgi:hypothetical protein